MIQLLPEGNIFGSKTNDEFAIASGGVFKRFEYLSLPFSITGREDKFKELLHRAETNNTPFKDELEKDPEAQKIVTKVINEMETHPAFSRQALEFLLPRAFAMDRTLAELPDDGTFESQIAKVVVSWKNLADFYCIEGLVGGTGDNNPFGKDTASLSAGNLDCLEQILPGLRTKLSNEDWNDVCLQLSSVVNRSPEHINHATNVLQHVFGEKDLNADEIKQAKTLLKDLVTTPLETTTDVGKFFNSIIRFHNWLPINLKQESFKGDQYDSICVPAKQAFESLPDSLLKQELAKITDATSPKGLALAMLVDQGKIGDKGKILKKVAELEEKVRVPSIRVFSFDDPSFDPGLVGGKWRGLKLLHDSKELLNLNYKVPEGFVISSLEIARMLDKDGILSLVNDDIFNLSESKRKEISRQIDAITIDDAILQRANELGVDIIARSSMLGEDGQSNFSGTFESVSCTPNTLEDAIKQVIKSYFSHEAVESRNDLGLSHVPGISVIVQKIIQGSGGVLHVTEKETSVSFADTAEDAVQGNGTHYVAKTIREAVLGTPLERIEKDIVKLSQIFGESDIEFVVAKDGVYLTQLRPKPCVAKKIVVDWAREKYCIRCENELAKDLESSCIIQLPLLGKAGGIRDENKLMAFIRKNKGNIIAIEGSMPSVAHVPNKIEGHFKIPYRMMAYANE